MARKIPFDLEAVGLELAELGYHLDLFRAIKDKNTLSAKWVCRHEPMPGSHGDCSRLAAGGTAEEAVLRARKLLGGRQLTEPDSDGEL
jgi:hypothetical protein